MNNESNVDVIWRRAIDNEAEARSRARFLKWYCLPAAVLAVVVGIVAGPGGALGIVILFGGIGLLLGGWIWLHGRNLRANPTMALENGSLRVGKTDVPIAMVLRWTTYSREISYSNPSAQGGTTTSSITVHVAGFRLGSVGPDGAVREEEREFVWPLLADDDQASLRAALESVLPGRWVPLESLRSVRS